MKTFYDKSTMIKEYIKSLSSNNYENSCLLTNNEKEFIKNNLPASLKQITNIEKNIFTNTNGETIKVNYNQKSKWISINGTSQLTIKNVFKRMNYEINESISLKENLKKCLKQVGIQKYIEWLLSGIIDTNYLVFINKDISEIEEYETSNFQVNLNNSKITTDIISTINEKDTWFIDIDDKKFVQVQFPASAKRPNNHIARINIDHLKTLYKEQKENNNETLGISVEVALCKKYMLEIPSQYENRYNETLVNTIMIDLDSHANINIPRITEIKATERQGQKKSSVDFMAGDKTISVKSNMLSSKKVCPPSIGQPGIKNGLDYYNNVFEENIKIEDFYENNMHEFKKQFQKHIKIIFFDQMKHLFSEDYILYYKQGVQKNTFELIKTTIHNWKLENEEDFHFSKNSTEWNESVTIYYKNNSLAEMQLHNKKNGRSPFKFRFNLHNLMIWLKILL